MFTFYEFFSGGGMARLGLGAKWECLFANDFDEIKATSYRANFPPATELLCSDIAEVTTKNLNSKADLAWASFPCQDLSLAGAGAGLRGERSGTFWSFWKLVESLRKEQRQPRTVVLENVFGALTSHGGNDFKVICTAFHRAGYRLGAMIVNASFWVPQSRPRLFIVGIENELAIPSLQMGGQPSGNWHPASLLRAQKSLPPSVRASWIWWNLPMPPERQVVFADIIENSPADVQWHSAAETKYLLSLMTRLHLQKVFEAKRLSHKTNRQIVGGVYKRTRNGNQRAEVRFDDIAGCLRTPVGGSSRQTIIVVDGDRVRSRLLAAREAARLMGIPDHYLLPDRYNSAYHLAGDGVVVPVVSHIATHLLEPILSLNAIRSAAE